LAKVRAILSIVMPGLVPGIHVFDSHNKKAVDGRVKPGHDEDESAAARWHRNC
jgi:hypothetical protein